MNKREIRWFGKRIIVHPTVSVDAARKLRTVIAHALEEPKRLNMKKWLAQKAYDDFQWNQMFGRYGYLGPEKAPSCGTVGCIAGWTIVLFGKRKRRRSDLDAAEEAVDLLELTERQEADLFYSIPPDGTYRLGTKKYVEWVAGKVLRFVETGVANPDRVRAYDDVNCL